MSWIENWRTKSNGCKINLMNLGGSSAALPTIFHNVAPTPKSNQSFEIQGTLQRRGPGGVRRRAGLLSYLARGQSSRIFVSGKQHYTVMSAKGDAGEPPPHCSVTERLKRGARMISIDLLAMIVLGAFIAGALFGYAIRAAISARRRRLARQARS